MGMRVVKTNCLYVPKYLMNCKYVDRFAYTELKAAIEFQISCSIAEISPIKFLSFFLKTDKI